MRDQLVPVEFDAVSVSFGGCRLYEIAIENLRQPGVGHVAGSLVLVDPVDEQFERLVDLVDVVRN